MAVTLLRRDRVKKAHYGFRRIGERVVRFFGWGLRVMRSVPLCAVGEGLAPPVPYVIEQTNASLREGGGTAKP